MDAAIAPSPSSSTAQATETSTSPSTGPESSAALAPEALRGEQIVASSADINIDRERHDNRPGPTSTEADITTTLQNSPIMTVPAGYNQTTATSAQNLQEFVQQSSPRLKGDLERLVQEHPELAPVLNALGDIKLDPQKMDMQAPELKKAIEVSKSLKPEEALASMVKAANDDGLLRVEMAKMSAPQLAELAQGLDSLASTLEARQAVPEQTAERVATGDERNAAGSEHARSQQEEQRLADRREQLSMEQDNLASREQSAAKEQATSREAERKLSEASPGLQPELALQPSPQKSGVEADLQSPGAQPAATGSLDQRIEVETGSVERTPSEAVATSPDVREINLQDLVNQKMPGLEELRAQNPELNVVLDNLSQFSIDPQNLARDLPALAQALENANGLNPDQQLALLIDALKEDGLLQIVEANRGSDEAAKLARAIISLEAGLVAKPGGFVERNIMTGNDPVELDLRRRLHEAMLRDGPRVVRELQSLTPQDYEKGWQRTKEELRAAGGPSASLVEAVERKAREDHHRSRHESRLERSDRAPERRDEERRAAAARMKAELAAIAATETQHLSRRERAQVQRAIKRMYRAEREELLGKKKRSRFMRKREVLREMQNLQRMSRRKNLRKRRIRGRMVARSRGDERNLVLKTRKGRKYQRR